MKQQTEKPSRKSSFKVNEIDRAMRALEKCGEKPSALEVLPSGGFRIELGERGARIEDGNIRATPTMIENAHNEAKKDWTDTYGKPV